MKQIFTREVRCSNCGVLTRHRNTILEEIIQYQSALSEGVRQINYLCPECNMLTRSPLLPGAEVFLGEDLAKRRVYPRPCIVSLQCEESRCESRVILLAAVKVGMSEDEIRSQMQTDWRIGAALCEKGRPPKHPFEIRGWYEPEN